MNFIVRLLAFLCFLAAAWVGQFSDAAAQEAMLLAISWIGAGAALRVLASLLGGNQ